MNTSLAALQEWVDEVAKQTNPDRIHWCDGSDTEYQALIQLMLDNGDLLELNQETHPGCYLHRSDPNDVARVEKLTFVCTEDEKVAGPNNNWMTPAEGHAKVDALFDGCMKGRTMYVIPYCMGPIDSPISRCGVEISDSPYVAANMRLMTRMGADALARIEREGTFVKAQHSIGELDPNKRLIMHFPEELTIKSIGSGYGGNALLGKKCHALRIGSYQAQQEGWLAEHMLIVGLESPEGERHYIAAAFPSACGKTNLAMLIPPEQFPGWKIWTVGDDIAWMSVGSDGRLYAINPEAGYFGVVPGTSPKTNKNAFDMIQRDTIFTNVGVTADNQPWWEGHPDGEPVTDWKGNPYDGSTPAAHPNSRFTVSAKQNPCYSEEAESATGVPISAIVFGGRRRELAPLVMEARNWTHGVLMGASVGSEQTAAAEGTVGEIRRDPMAMKPFCGYNFSDYWGHWLSFANKSDNLPKIFHVNWFRQDKDGKFMWPGFGENLRVLQWIIGRCEGTTEAKETAIGNLPADNAIDLTGIHVADDVMQNLTNVEVEAWRGEVKGVQDYLESFGGGVPQAMFDELEKTQAALN
jgi:phosphoenolpyruvate carboxykinase (GTP)